MKLCTLGKLPKKLKIVFAHCNYQNSILANKFHFWWKMITIWFRVRLSQNIKHLICTLTANFSCATTDLLELNHWKTLGCMNVFRIVTRFFFLLYMYETQIPTPKVFQDGCYPNFFMVANKPMFLNLEHWVQIKWLNVYKKVEQIFPLANLQLKVSQFSIYFSYIFIECQNHRGSAMHSSFTKIQLQFASKCVLGMKQINYQSLNQLVTIIKHGFYFLFKGGTQM